MDVSNTNLRFRVFDGNHNMYYEETNLLSIYNSTTDYYTDGFGINYYYHVWTVDEMLAANIGSGGYVTIAVQDANLGLVGYEISSMRISPDTDPQPVLCPLNHGDSPPTATPIFTPTNQPTPTVGPSPTLAPTSPGTTVTPLPLPTPTAVNTPFQWNTTTPLPTATRWPALILPTLRFETPSGVEENEGNLEESTPDLSGFDDVATSVALIATQFYTSTNLGIGFDEPIGIPTPNGTLVPSQPGFGPGAPEAVPEFAGTFSEFLLAMPDHIAGVVNVMATIPVLFPNMYPMVYVVLVIVMSVVLTYIVVYGVKALVALVVWIMRLLGLIPFVG